MDAPAPLNQSWTKVAGHPPLFWNPRIQKRCRKRSFATGLRLDNTIDIENPLPGGMTTKLQKLVRKFVQNAPAGRILAFHWNRYCFDNLVFLKYYCYIRIFDIVSKYLTSHLVYVKYSWIYVKYHRICVKYPWFCVKYLTSCQTIFIWCQIICQIIWHRIIKFR